ncbi:MAG: zinc-binding dehydrogenase [Candidatus Omnitrophica bacterium]|nr:zinc-binding dehydrogenase [Candidatus Omnitrophota bacterium]
MAMEEAVRPRIAKAAILVEQNAPLLIADIEIPPVDVGQVLVRVQCSGICGSQLNEISGRRGQDRFLPHLLGHEGAGRVVEVGPGVRKIKPGDQVVLHWMEGSGIESAPPIFRLDGTVINAGRVTTFSEYTVVSENRVTPIPHDINPGVACLLGCSVTTGLGIVIHEANVTPGQSLVVFGVGGIGLNVVQGADLVHADPIVAVDVDDRKLVQACAFGATHTVSVAQAETGLEARLKDLTEGAGFDVAVDTTGKREVFQLAYRVTGDAGKTVMAGVHDAQQPITIDAYPLHFGRRIIGSHGGATQPDSDIPRYLQLYRRKRLKLDEQITHRYSLDNVNEALEAVRRGEAVRCVLKMA